MQEALGLKHALKASLRPLVRAAWPVLESASQHHLQRSCPKLHVTWSSRWSADFDDALEALPPLAGCPHRLYRELLHPAAAAKRHALVCDNGEPIAIVSLRWREPYWEPVTYQCLAKSIAPARDTSALGRALNALGLAVRVGAGIGEEIEELTPRRRWSYDCYALDLTGDYEAHWRAKKRQYTVRRARKTLAEMAVRVDGEGDLEWIVEQWRVQWAADPGREVVAAEDRLRFWSALQRNGTPDLSLHTLVLLHTGRRASGLVLTKTAETAMMQCAGRDPAFDDEYVRAAAIIAAVEWAVAQGLRTFDLAGGAAKRYWAPVAGVRHGAIFRPALLDRFSWALERTKSDARRGQ